MFNGRSRRTGSGLKCHNGDSYSGPRNAELLILTRGSSGSNGGGIGSGEDAAPPPRAPLPILLRESLPPQFHFQTAEIPSGTHPNLRNFSVGPKQSKRIPRLILELQSQCIGSCHRRAKETTEKVPQ